MAPRMPPVILPFVQPSSSAALDDTLYARVLTWSDAQLLDQQAVTFLLPGNDQAHPVDMQVYEVAQKPSAAPHILQFSIVFRGPLAPQMSQRTYRMRHAECGDWAVFITPIAQSVGHIDYEACFSYRA